MLNSKNGVNRPTKVITSLALTSLLLFGSASLNINHLNSEKVNNGSKNNIAVRTIKCDSMSCLEYVQNKITIEAQAKSRAVKKSTKKTATKKSSKKTSKPRFRYRVSRGMDFGSRGAFLNHMGGNRKDVRHAIWKVAEKYDMPVSYLYGVAMIETGEKLNPKAHSSSGAKGVMQLMPATARGFGVTNPYNANQSLDAGARYLRNLINYYNGKTIKDNHGKVVPTEIVAMMAYNMGRPNLDKHIKRNHCINYNRVPKETKLYVDKMRKYYKF